MSAVRRSIRIVAVTAVAAAAILPGSAIAETPSSGTLPACAPGVLPTREQPCKPAPCAAGVYEQAPRPRALMGGFLSRVWRFGADVDSYDAATNTLNVTVSKILNLPKRFKAQDDSIVDQDADVVFAKTTKVFDADGKRIRTESAYDAALDAAESVSVTGKITPQAKWNKDEDGTPVTTIRAKRVTITG
jgi:hypothetical protein